MTVRSLVQFLLLNSQLDDKIMIVDKDTGEVKDLSFADFYRVDYYRGDAPDAEIVFEIE